MLFVCGGIHTRGGDVAVDGWRGRGGDVVDGRGGSGS
jgi:hypothetical protein